MDFVEPLRGDLVVADSDVTYTAKYYKPAIKITGVTDESHSNYNNLTTYNTGDFAIVPELKRRYRCTTDSTLDKFPPANPTLWTDYGAINSYSMFAADENIGSVTTGADCIFEFDFSRQDTVSGLGISFSTVDILLIDTDGINYESDYDAGTTYATDDGVIYNNKLYISLQNSNTGNAPDSSPTYWQENTDRIHFDETTSGIDFGVDTFTDYLFKPLQIKARAILTGLRYLPASILRFDFTGSVEIGTMAYGRKENMGVTLVGSSVRVESTSNISINEFTGFKTVNRYGSVRILDVDVVFETELFNRAVQQAERVLDKTILWIPTDQDRFSESIVLGSIEDLEIPMEVATKTITKATVVGVKR